MTEVAVLSSFRGGRRLPILVRVYTITLQIVRAQKKRKLPQLEISFSISITFQSKEFYFTLFTIAVKASGWFIAKSARTLRLMSISFLCNAPIKRE